MKLQTSNPLVSIIVPVYNAEAYVDVALSSALNQTYENVEIIIVDDGSNDGSLSRIGQFTDTRIRVISQENQGQSAAINRGVAASSGEYIKLLDADDWINPEHIACQVASVAEHSDCIASCRWGYFWSNSANTNPRDEVTNRDYDRPLEWIIDSLTKDEGMMGGWKWLIPRKVWDRGGGYDSRLSLNNDFHFSIATLLASQGVRFAEGAVYGYRKGLSGALSTSYGRKAMESALLTTQLGVDLLLARESSASIRRIAADRFQSWLFRFYPDFPDLTAAAECRIQELGGSSLRLNGGKVLKLVQPIIGWKCVRRLQALAYRWGWQKVLAMKARKKLESVQ